MKETTKMTFRLDYSVKQDFIKKCDELGFNPSECLRESVGLITYNGELAPKEKVLAHHLSRLQKIISPEQAEKVWHDFCEFMAEYRYTIYTARMDENEFAENFEVSSPDSEFCMRFVHMHGYALIPVEVKDLLRHYYHDAEAIQLRRELITNITKAHAAEADFSTLLSPAEQEKIARTTSL